MWAHERQCLYFLFVCLKLPKADKTWVVTLSTNKILQCVTRRTQLAMLSFIFKLHEFFRFYKERWWKYLTMIFIHADFTASHWSFVFNCIPELLSWHCRSPVDRLLQDRIFYLTSVAESTPAAKLCSTTESKEDTNGLVRIFLGSYGWTRYVTSAALHCDREQEEWFRPHEVWC